MNTATASVPATAVVPGTSLAHTFRRDGCAGPFPLVDEAAAGGLRDLYCAAAGVDPVEHGPSTGVLTAWHHHLPWAYALAPAPAILDRVEEILGPDLILWAWMAWYKQPFTGKRIPWHQDASYWPIEPKKNVTAWVALDHCTPENGCLRLIPGTHHAEIGQVPVDDATSWFNKGADPAAVDESRAIDIVLRPGEFVLFNEGTLHGSEPNRSARARFAFSLRYTTPEVNYDLDEVSHPALDDAAAWDLLIRQLDLLQPGFIRFGLPPNPHCLANGLFQGGTPHFERLRRLDAWAQRSGCTIMLDTFLLPEAHVIPADAAMWKKHPNGQFQYAARDNRRLARDFLAPLILQATEELGLASVRWFNIINEPFCYGVYDTPELGPDAFAHYVEMYRELRTALTDLGLPRDRVQLAGLDLIYFFNRDAMRTLIQQHDLASVLDGLSVHYYHLYPDVAARGISDTTDGRLWARMDLQIEGHTRELANYCHVIGKPLMATEIGTFCYGFRDNPPGTATFDAQLTVSTAIIRMLNVGITTFAFWSLMNPDTIDGHCRTFRLQQGAAIYARHAGPMRAVLSQVVRPGATVTPIDSSHPARGVRTVHAVALGDQAHFTILVANDDPLIPAAITFTRPESWPADPLPHAWCLQESGAVRCPTLATVEPRCWTAEIPPRCLVVFTSRSLFIADQLEPA